MVKIIFVSCVLALLFSSYSCWVMNDINPKMFNKIVFNEQLDEAEVISYLKDINFIFPGTKWCGAGNIAANYSDLGPEREADMCCRTHDHCPDVIHGGETKHNLTNDMFYSRLSCDCDHQFHTCLKTAATNTAKVIGYIYFDALFSQCFRLDYPKEECIKRGGWLDLKCLEYKYDTNGTKLYQWFDVEDF